LGIGVNTAMFTFVRAMMAMPQRFHAPEELVYLWGTNERHESTLVSIPDYLDFREQSESFADIALCRIQPGTLADRGEAERVSIVQASANFIPLLGLDAALGRLYRPDEGSLGAEPVLLLSDGFWRRRYGGDPDVLGKLIVVDRTQFTIIGVLPPEAGSQYTWGLDLMKPLPLEGPGTARKNRSYRAWARLRPDADVEQAQVEASGIAARLAEAYPDTNSDVGVRLRGFMDLHSPLRHKIFAMALLLAVGIVLLIACVNLANMLLARATSRWREFAVRMALGSGRSRLVRQLLTESLLISVIGGAAGLLVGAWSLDLFIAAAGDSPVFTHEIGLNPSVAVYALILSLGTAAVFGLAPALMASRLTVGEILKEGATTVSAGRGRNRLRSALVIGQLAIGMPLLISCGLVLKHLTSLRHVDLGFNTENLVTVRIHLPEYRYGETPQRTAFCRDALEAVQAMPGVKAAAVTHSFPLGSGGWRYIGVRVEGADRNERENETTLSYRIVSPDYFATMEILIRNGRCFTEQDHAEAQPVAIVNRRLAESFWPDRDAIGRAITIRPGTDTEFTVSIVGMVEDAGRQVMGEPPQPEIYLPYSQRLSNPEIVLVAHSFGDPALAVPALRSIIRNLDPDVPIMEISTVPEIIERWLNDDKILAGFLTGIGLLALCLASVGLFGVMAYSVAQRTHEIGVRTALGADGRTIFKLVLKRCLTLSSLGVTAGILLSIPVSFVLATQLYGVGGADPLAYFLVVLLLIAVGLLAGYIPARRATKVNPVDALRYQ